MGQPALVEVMRGDGSRSSSPGSSAYRGLFYGMMMMMMMMMMMQVYQPSGPKAMADGMIEVKERHAFVVFFKTDESGFVPVGQVRRDRHSQDNAKPRRVCMHDDTQHQLGEATRKSFKTYGVFSTRTNPKHISACMEYRLEPART